MYVYIYIHVYMYIHMCICLNFECIRIYTNILYMYIWPIFTVRSSWVWRAVFTDFGTTHKHMYMCLYVWIYVYTYVRILKCVYMCMYIYVCLICIHMFIIHICFTDIWCGKFVSPTCYIRWLQRYTQINVYISSYVYTYIRPWPWIDIYIYMFYRYLLWEVRESDVLYSLIAGLLQEHARQPDQPQVRVYTLFVSLTPLISLSLSFPLAFFLRALRSRLLSLALFLYVYVYMYVFVCIHVYIRIYMYTNTTFLYARVCENVRVHICIHIREDVYICTYVSVLLQVYI